MPSSTVTPMSHLSKMPMAHLASITIVNIKMECTNGDGADAIDMRPDYSYDGAPGKSNQHPSGKPFEIQWEGSDGATFTLTLLDASDPANVKVVEVLDADEKAFSYTWTPSDTLESGHYAFLISDGTDVNYSEQWLYEASQSGDGGSSGSAESSSESSTTTTEVRPSSDVPSSTEFQTSLENSFTTSTSLSSTTTSAPPDSSSGSAVTSSPNASDSSIESQTSSESSFTTSTTLSSSPVSSLGSTLTSSPNSSGSSNTNSGANSGLSTGAKAGIGAGVGIAGLLILILLGIILYRRGRAAGRKGMNSTPTDHAELDTSPPDVKKHELAGQSVSEVHGSSFVPPEVWQGHYDQWRREPKELDASSPSRG
ncbi:hypothetical protein GGR57DRAFT_507306 [Xylariaceae sp. FL1272]|nr:hypothetical protein GGR57DRAFT_507306 [Xylariaceae sp. FL1272]